MSDDPKKPTPTPPFNSGGKTGKPALDPLEQIRQERTRPHAEVSHEHDEAAKAKAKAGEAFDDLKVAVSDAKEAAGHAKAEFANDAKAFTANASAAAAEAKASATDKATEGSDAVRQRAQEVGAAVRARVDEAKHSGKEQLDRAKESATQARERAVQTVRDTTDKARERAQQAQTRFRESGYAPASENTLRNVAIGAAVGGVAVLALRALGGDGGKDSRRDEDSEPSYSGAPNTGKREPVHGGLQSKIPVGSEVHVRESITVERPAKELYAKWRRFENLPLILTHLKSVTTLEDGRSYWETEGPTGPVSWYARTTSDVPGRRLAWRSEERADVPNRGEVRFEPTPGGKGTKITVNMYYNPPGGVFGQALASLFGESPSKQISDDLKRFKRTMEGQKG